MKSTRTNAHPRRTVPVAIVLLGLVPTGCTSYRPADPGQVAPASKVLLHLEPPRALVFVDGRGDSLRLNDVYELHGRLVERTADSFTIDVSAARAFGLDAPQRFASRARVRVPSQAIRVGKTNTGMTILLIVGALGLIGMLFGAMASDPQPEPVQKDDAKYAG